MTYSNARLLEPLLAPANNVTSQGDTQQSWTHTIPMARENGAVLALAALTFEVVLATFFPLGVADHDLLDRGHEMLGQTDTVNWYAALPSADAGGPSRAWLLRSRFGAVATGRVDASQP